MPQRIATEDTDAAPGLEVPAHGVKPVTCLHVELHNNLLWTGVPAAPCCVPLSRTLKTGQLLQRACRLCEGCRSCGPAWDYGVQLHG